MRDPNMIWTGTVWVDEIVHQQPGIEIRRASWDSVPGYVIFVQSQVLWISDWDVFLHRGPRRLARGAGLAFVAVATAAPASRAAIRQILADCEYLLPREGGGQDNGDQRRLEHC